MRRRLGTGYMNTPFDKIGQEMLYSPNDITGAFIFYVDTTLLSTYTVELPLGGTVDCIIHWGDGTQTVAKSAGDYSHTYAFSRQYKIQIDGDLTEFGDGAAWTGVDAVTSVSTFGTTGITALPGAFYGATSLTAIPSTVTGVTDISDMLHDATSYNGVELATWDITSLTDASNALDGCGLEPDHYNQVLMSWADQVANNSDLPASITLGADGLWWGNAEYADLTHADTDTARSYLTTTALWTFSGDTEAMVLVFDTSKETGTTVELPLRGAIDCTVYWGDDTSNSYVAANSKTNKTHTWASEGTYTAYVTGSVKTFGADGWVGVKKLIQFRSFGTCGLTSLNYAMSRADNIEYVPKYLPPEITNLSHLFYYIFYVLSSPVDTYSRISNMEYWDTGHVNDYSNLLERANIRDAYINIGNWNDAYATNVNMAYMLANAPCRFIDLSGFVYGNIRNMSRAFYHSYATTFEIPTNLTNCVDLSNMVVYNNYNSNAGNIQFNTTEEINMTSIFYASAINIENYNKTLIGWANYIYENGAPINKSITFQAKMYNDSTYSEYSESQFDNAVDARNWLTTATSGGGAGWVLAGDYDEEYQTEYTVDVTNENQLYFTVGITQNGGHLRVDYGDGLRAWTSNDYPRPHAYTETGLYTVTFAINHSNATFSYFNAGKSYLVSVNRLAKNISKTANGYKDCINLISIPENVDWVTDVSYMLSGATSYAGTELSTWDCSIWTDATGLLDNTAISVSDYDTILAAWAATITAAEIGEGEQEITVGVDGLVYSAAALTAIDTLETAGWTFVGHTQETP